MKRTALAALVLAAVACSGPEPSRTVDRDTLSRRQKDSITATLPLPGAGGVGRALEAGDRARERAARHDSLLR